jgi:hypothetical protein
LVNYSRRYAKGLQSLRQQILNNDFGKFQGGTGYYGNGLLNNGSHMINLVEFFIGAYKRSLSFSENF